MEATNTLRIESEYRYQVLILLFATAGFLVGLFAPVVGGMWPWQISFLLFLVIYVTIGHHYLKVSEERRYPPRHK